MNKLKELGNMIWSIIIKTGSIIVSIIVLIGICFLVWTLFLKSAPKIDQLAINKRIISEKKVEQVIITYDKVKQETEFALAELKKRELILQDKIKQLTNKIKDKQEIYAELESNCGDAAAELKNQFDLCLGKTQVLEDSLIISNAQIKEKSNLLDNCNITVESMRTEYNVIRVDFKKLQEEGKQDKKFLVTLNIGYGALIKNGEWIAGWIISISGSYKLMELF